MLASSIIVSAKDFDQPGSKESNPETFHYHLREFLTQHGHSIERVATLTKLVDKHMPKHQNMKLLAGVFAMLVINSAKDITPNLFMPLEYDPSKAEAIFRPYIHSVMPTKEKLSKIEEGTYAKYVVTFPRILLEYSKHVGDYESLLKAVGYQG
ncbi:Hypothetical protein POVR1_LOCUS605 [uncultured virus]|nr:Hypothetical protein POVR1_LOCUS605 [uncultured virus]